MMLARWKRTSWECLMKRQFGSKRRRQKRNKWHVARCNGSTLCKWLLYWWEVERLSWRGVVVLTEGGRTRPAQIDVGASKKNTDVDGIMMTLALWDNWIYVNLVNLRWLLASWNWTEELDSRPHLRYLAKATGVSTIPPYGPVFQETWKIVQRRY